jgi:hypothetical protein
MIITYSEFVYLEIQHATRVHRIVISDFSGCTNACTLNGTT